MTTTGNTPVLHLIGATAFIGDFQQVAAQHMKRGDLDSALMALSSVARLADSAIHQTVDQMRADGETWAHIGSMLGITKQAAQQGYGPRFEGDRHAEPRAAAIPAEALNPQQFDEQGNYYPTSTLDHA